MAGELAVWLYGSQVALIDQQRPGQPRLIYTPEAVDSYEAGTPLLSLTLPVRPERYPQGVVKAFLDGILPEGDTRRAIADELGLRANDTFGLMKALGRDCAGAIVVQPVEEPAPPPATTTTARPLSESELGDLIANLRNAPLGVGGRVRVSLAGVQEKLLLTRLPEGRWGSPVDGTPSTHILKPEVRDLPKTVENEAFCMRLARNLGLPVADIETMKIQIRNLIVVTRYDRHVDASGRVERIHQEDFCQATGRPPNKKYQEDGGPALRDIARILSATDPDSVALLLRAVTLHVLVGNGDAHAKNYSLLHEPSGALRLAPLYDVMSTLFYGDDRLAMYIDNVRQTDRVTSARLLNEASSWGLARKTAAEILDDLLAAAPNAIDRAATETPGLPEEITAIVASQLDRLRQT
jgi:serine/threonine-protein kinase HipA